MMKRSRVVIIGRNGQVARALIPHLSALGFDVVTLARPEFDLTDPAAVAAAIATSKPRIVINPAAYTAVDKAEDEYDLATAINATAAGIIAKAAADVGAAIIHFSTDYVFDGTKVESYVETDATAPLGVYGASKLAGERAVAAANPVHVILRTAWVMSPDGSNFLKTILRLAESQEVLSVVGDQRGSPTFAADLATATARIIQALIDDPADVCRHGIFHVASAPVTTRYDLARAILTGAELRGLAPLAKLEQVITADFPTRARRPANSTLATAKFEHAYGITMPAWHASLEASLDTLLPTSHMPDSNAALRDGRSSAFR